MVASDFIRSVLDVFAYEREPDHALVIAAGVPDAWLDGDGIAIERLRTPFGALSYSLARRDGRVRLEVSGDGFAMPPGGIVFAPPGVARDAKARVGSRRERLRDGMLRLRQLPAVVDVD